MNNYINSSKNKNLSSNSSPFSYKTIQNSSHRIFGIDLNLDWYTLTELSLISYDLGKMEGDKQKIPFVTVGVDDEYLNQNATEEFLNIGFKNVLIFFPILDIAVTPDNVKELTPVVFTANIEYTSDTEYAKNAKGDFNRVVYLVMDQFGAPDSTMKKEWGASFQWKFGNAELLLNMTKNGHNISLAYLKK